MAGSLAPEQPEREQPRKIPVVSDVTPLSLGIRIAGDMVDVIIKRNSTLPTAKKVRKYKTTNDNQVRVKIDVVQGESQKASENHSLGKYVFEDIPKGEAGAHEIEVTF